MTDMWSHEERRRYTRIEKHFFISYYVKDDPSERHDISQLKNISLGGMCFIASKGFKPQAQMCIELKTPYFSETAHLEGTILGVTEKVPGIIYETRLEFSELSDTAKVTLNKIVETFSKISSEKGWL